MLQDDVAGRPERRHHKAVAAPLGRPARPYICFWFIRPRHPIQTNKREKCTVSYMQQVEPVAAGPSDTTRGTQQQNNVRVCRPGPQCGPSEAERHVHIGLVRVDRKVLAQPPGNLSGGSGRCAASTTAVSSCGSSEAAYAAPACVASRTRSVRSHSYSLSARADGAEGAAASA